MASVDDEEGCETSSLIWVNSLLKGLWPNAATALENFIKNELTSKLRDGTPFSLHFARFSLGNGVPSFGPIEVRRHSESHVLLELETRYSSAVDILLTAGSTGSLSLGVKRLDFFGKLCLELKPLLDTWPIVGAVIIYFAAQPKLELQFSGIVDAPMPGLAKRVQAAVDGLFSTLVLPNFKCIQVTSDERMLSLAACTREPIGVLKVHVCRGINLAGANWKMGAVRSFTSNPYCVVRLGGTSLCTSTVRNTTNPDWPETDTAYFIVHNREQEVQVDVMDNDQGFFQRNFVGLLGRLRVSVSQLLSMRDAAKEKVCRYKLDTSQVKSGLLHVDDPVNTGVPSEIDLKYKWLEFAPASVSDRADRNHPYETHAEPHGVALVELHFGTGFPEEAAMKGLRWKCWIQEAGAAAAAAVYSSSGKSPEHPDFQTSLPDCLHHAIDRLNALSVDAAEIAAIIEADQAEVEHYLMAKSKHVESEAQRKLEHGEVQCMELSWYETLAVLVSEPDTSVIHLSLVNARGEVMGHLEPLRALDVMSGTLKEELTCKLTLEQSHAKPSLSSHVSNFSSWIFPTCTPISKGRFQAVQMHFAARYLALAGAPVTFQPT
ncbi:Extended synaptotagmin-2-A (E-Syt2-A) [Durusdinium trenchii]